MYCSPKSSTPHEGQVFSAAQEMTLLTDALHVGGAGAVMLIGSLPVALVSFIAIQVYVTVSLCLQPSAPFVEYDEQRATVMVLYFTLWTAVFRWRFGLGATGTFTIFFCWDGMEAAYLMGSYIAPFNHISKHMPALWWLPVVCIASLLQSSDVRVPKVVQQLSACGLIFAGLLGAVWPGNEALLQCLDDGTTDEMIDVLIWMLVTCSMRIAEGVVGAISK
jgi:hypothetical protein